MPNLNAYYNELSRKFLETKDEAEQIKIHLQLVDLRKYIEAQEDAQ